MSHRWHEHLRTNYKTERICLNGCPIVKVTRHENEGGKDSHWTEFWRNGEKLETTSTPACEPVEAPAEA